MSRYILLALIVLIVGLAGATGYVIGRDDGDDNGQSSGSDCPIMQVPVSDHVEGMCIPEAVPLFELFDERSVPPGSHAEGWVSIGNLWLNEVDNKLCWVNETDETRCSSPG